MMDRKRNRLAAAIAAGLFVGATAGCGGGEQATPEPEAEPAAGGQSAPAEGMAVMITSPEDGAEVSSPVTVAMTVAGLEIVPAGEDLPRSGHHHLLVDVDVPAIGVAIPNDANNVHMGAAQTEMALELAPGEHRIIAVVGDFAHRVMEPSVEDTIHVVVR